MIPPRRPRGTLRRPPRLRATGLLLPLVALVLALLVPPAAAAAPPGTADAPVSVVLDAMTPRTVTADGPGELVVTGHVANRSAVGVRDLGVRLERGDALSGSRAALGALEGDAPTEPVAARVDAPPAVGPGQDAPFALHVPLTRGAGGLALTGPGVVPLRVAAIGTLGSAGATRLGAVRLLLPVVGVPGGGPVAAPPVGRATGVSVLYPLADRPRRLPVVPGGPTVLTDDDLAASFAPGGRLAGLVDGLGRAAPVGSAAARSVCLAVDADLLETAQAMAGGYEVRTPGGGTRPGAGAPAAAQWLQAVRAQARGRCVTALPYADTDLVATARGNLTDLTTAAVATGTRRVADLLGVTPLPDTVWPAGGVVDERSLADLTSAGTRALVLDPDVLDDGPPSGALARLPGPPGAAPVALTLDPLAATALAPRTGDREAASSTSPAGTPAPLAAQGGLAAIALRALQDVPDDQPPPVEVVAPPRDWAASAAEAGALLDAVDDLTRLGLARPVDLGNLVGGAGATTPLPTTALASSGVEVDGLSESVVTRVAQVRDRQRELLAAAERDGVGAPSPSDFVEPLTDGVLRSLSATRRGDPPAQDAAVRAVEQQNDELRSLVRVVQPSGSYSLGSNDAPLLLTVENRLPVAVRVDVVLEPTNGLRTAPLPEITVPAFGSRQVQVEVEVTRAGQFAVDAQARTPGGEPLGPTARLLLRSTAYGTITVWLTASAAVVLVILASVRIARRVRAARRDGRSRRSRHRSDPTTTADPQNVPTRELQKR